jgi:hypothetical protein
LETLLSPVEQHDESKRTVFRQLSISQYVSFPNDSAGYSPGPKYSRVDGRDDPRKVRASGVSCMQSIAISFRARYASLRPGEPGSGEPLHSNYGAASLLH